MKRMLPAPRPVVVPCLIALSLTACQGSANRPAPAATSPQDGYAEAAEMNGNPMPLTTAEIRTLYSGVQEYYEDFDQPGIRVTSVYQADGRMTFAWSFRGEVRQGTGRWYAENGQLCIDYDALLPTPETPDPNCRSMTGVRGDRSTLLGATNERGLLGGTIILQPIE
ncbi:MAG: DUF995 domain-containing protein [Alphaproteobacteria bacterium]